MSFRAPLLTAIDFTLLGRRVAFRLRCNPDFVPAMAMSKFVADTDGVYEPEVVHLLVRALRPGDVAVDGGANIGMLTMAMSQLVGDLGRVLAVEATPRTFRHLRANIDLNDAANVVAVQCALWEVEGTVMVHESMDAATNSLMRTEGSIVQTACPALTLGALCGDLTPRLVKLDIEGAEGRVLMAADDVLRRGVDFISCEVNRNVMGRFGVAEAAIFEHMAALGYATFVLHRDGRAPALIAPGHRIESAMDCFNVLFSTPSKVNEIWEATT